MIFGYCRVSTEDQAELGASVEAQQAAIRAWWKDSRTFPGIAWMTEQASARDLGSRPVLLRLLERVRLEKGTLVVSRLDRLTRSIADFQTLLMKAENEGWELVCLNPLVDMTTPYGRAMAAMASVFAQLERELIAQRTKEGIAAKKAAGEYSGGHPEQVTQEVKELIYKLRNQRLSLREIADTLTELKIPTPASNQGAYPAEHPIAWRHSTVGAIIARR